MENKMPCSGKQCPMNYPFDVKSCKEYDKCRWYIPEKDFSRLDAVIELAEKEFDITDNKQKEKLKILFNAYVTAYLSIYCTI